MKTCQKSKHNNNNIFSLILLEKKVKMVSDLLW